MAANLTDCFSRTRSPLFLRTPPASAARRSRTCHPWTRPAGGSARPARTRPAGHPGVSRTPRQLVPPSPTCLGGTYLILVSGTGALTVGDVVHAGAGRRVVTGYWRVRGTGAPRSSKARRWTGVGLVSFSIRWPLKVMVWRSRVDRWSSRSPYLRTGSLPLVRLAPRRSSRSGRSMLTPVSLDQAARHPDQDRDGGHREVAVPPGKLVEAPAPAGDAQMFRRLSK